MSGMKGYRWLQFSPEAPAGADAVARVRSDGGRAIGYLASWPVEADHPKDALRVDARAIDPNGDPAWASLAIAPGETKFDFDEPAVVHAIRRVLLEDPADVLSTLIRGRMGFAGAITAIRDEDLGRLYADPFDEIVPARVVQVDAGVLGKMPAPTGPGTQRYGAGNPWPWDSWPGN